MSAELKRVYLELGGADEFGWRSVDAEPPSPGSYVELSRAGGDKPGFQKGYWVAGNWNVAGLLWRSTPAPAASAQAGTGWHIVLCRPNRELTAVAGLTDIGIEAMCPAKYIRRPTGKRDQNGRPVLSMEASPSALIPGYAFVRVAGNGDEYHAIKSVDGVYDLCRRPGNSSDVPSYARLLDAEIADLRAIDNAAFEAFQAAIAAEIKKKEQALLPKSKQEPSVPFKRGLQVRVFSTALGKEVYGAMTQKRGGGMVKILVDHIEMVVPHVDVQTMESAL
jgi:transcription antitermination factor NusG